MNVEVTFARKTLVTERTLVREFTRMGSKKEK